MIRTNSHKDETQLADHLTLENWEWPTGIALYTFWRIHEKSSSPEFHDFLVSWFDDKLATLKPHRNVNTVAPLLALTYLYEDDPRPQWKAVMEDWVDWVMHDMPRTNYGGFQHMTVLEYNEQQLWDDTLFMTVLFLARAGIIFNRPELVEESKRQFLVHVKFLQDPGTGLFYHGWTFKEMNNFGAIFWARGNSWFTSGAVEFLELCGASDGVGMFLKDCLADQVQALVRLQRKDGLFCTVLDDADSYAETSATANIAYALLKGIRLGYIDARYAQNAQAAVDAVIAQIGADGTVGGVSYGTGMGMNKEHYTSIAITPTGYGQGLTLLMLSELI